MEQQQQEYTTVQQMRNDLAETMRSVKDTIAMSFQQLNLTLSSMNGTLRNLATVIPSTSSTQLTNMMPSTQAMYLGSMSQPMAQFSSNATGLDLLGLTAQRPYNVSSLEFYGQRENEMRYRAGVLGVGIGSDVANGLSSLGFFGLGNQMLKAGIMKGLPGRGLLLPLGMAMLGSMAMSPLLSAYETESQNYMQDTASFQRLGARFNGNGFSFNSAANLSGWLNTSGAREYKSQRWDSTMLGTEGYRDLAMTGLANGLFQGKSENDLKKQIESAAQVVRLLGGIMGSKDVKEAINVLTQLKQQGINPLASSSMIAELGRSAFGLGGMAGLSGGDMMNFGMGIGGQVQSNLRLPGIIGSRFGMHGYVHAANMERMGILNPTDMAMMGGTQGAAALYAHAKAQAASSPLFGGMLGAALMSPNGNIGAGSIGGGYFGVMGAAMNNVMSPGRMAMYMVNQKHLASQLAGQSSEYADPVGGMIRQAMSPLIDASGAEGRQEKVSMAAVMLSRTMGIGMEEAKMLAETSLFPEHHRRMMAMRDINIQQGRAAERRAMYTPGAIKGQLGHSISGFFSGLYADLIASPAGNFTKTSADYFGDATVDRSKEVALSKTRPFDWENIGSAGSIAESFANGGKFSISDSSLNDYYNFNSGMRGGRTSSLRNLILSTNREMVGKSDMLDAFQRQNTYKEYYDKFGSMSGSYNPYKAMSELGLSFDDSDYSSDYRNKLGGGLEFIADKYGRKKLLSNLAGNTNGAVARTELDRLLGQDTRSMNTASIEHRLRDKGLLNAETRKYLAALNLSDMSKGYYTPQSGMSAAALLEDSDIKNKAYAAARSIEGRYSDEKILKGFIDMNQSSSMSSYDMEELLRYTGTSIEGLSKLSKRINQEGGLGEDDLNLAADIVDKYKNRGWGLNWNNKELKDMLGGFKNSAFANYMEDRINNGSLNVFSDADREKTLSQFRSISRGAGQAAENERFNFAAKNLWQLNAQESDMLRNAFASKDFEAIQKAIGGITADAPGLKDLGDRAGNLRKMLGRYDKNATFGSLGNDQKREVQKALGFDVSKDLEGESLEQLSKRSVTAGVQLATASAVDMVADNKKMEDTIIMVGGQNCLAVVAFDPPDKIVQRVARDGRGQIVIKDISTVTGNEQAGKDKNGNPTSKGGSDTTGSKNPSTSDYNRGEN